MGDSSSPSESSEALSSTVAVAAFEGPFVATIAISVSGI